MSPLYSARVAAPAVLTPVGGISGGRDFSVGFPLPGIFRGAPPFLPLLTQGPASFPRSARNSRARQGPRWSDWPRCEARYLFTGRWRYYRGPVRPDRLLEIGTSRECFGAEPGGYPCSARCSALVSGGGGVPSRARARARGWCRPTLFPFFLLRRIPRSEFETGAGQFVSTRWLRIVPLARGLPLLPSRVARRRPSGS